MTEHGHERIAWAQIELTNTDTPRSGLILCSAPPVRGSRAFWGIPDERRGGEPFASLVVRASRRHRIGNNIPISGEFRHVAQCGRWVDKGETYAESHPESESGCPTYHQPPMPKAWQTEESQ